MRSRNSLKKKKLRLVIIMAGMVFPLGHPSPLDPPFPVSLASFAFSFLPVSTGFVSSDSALQPSSFETTFVPLTVTANSSSPSQS